MRDPWDASRVNRRKAASYGAAIVVFLVFLGVTKPGVLGTIGVIFAFFAMIMLHEFGHFVMAKRAGMKVTEFFVGFGPRLWSVRKGETEYGVKAIPAGGYVRIVGMNNLEEIDPEDEPRTYRSKPFHQRLAVAVAGSTMHFLIAFFLIFLAIGPVGLPSARPIVADVSSDLPAAKAGFQVGDHVVAINGKRVKNWPDVPKVVQKNAGRPLHFTLLRSGHTIEVDVTPQAAEIDGAKGVFIGVSPQRYTAHEPLPKAFVKSGVEVGRGMKLAVHALGGFFSPSGVRHYLDNVSGKSADTGRVMSPIGAGRAASQAVQSGLADVLLFLFAINLFVGVFNMVPLLPLDGGLVAIAVFEKVASSIRRRKVQVDVAKLLPITATVFILLVMLGISALYLDIVSPLSNPF